MIDASLQYDGLLDAAGDRVDRITGTLRNGPLEMRESDGTSCFQIPRPPDCRFEMRRNEVRAGSNVSIEPRLGVRVTFTAVLSPGTVSVIPLTPLDAVLPPGFQNVAGELQVVFRLESTASFTGAVVACFSYEDADQDGFVDATVPPIPEERIRVLHEENGVFVDRTLHLSPNTNEACTRTSDFSRFALGKLDTDRDSPRRRAVARRGQRALPRSPSR